MHESTTGPNKAPSVSILSSKVSYYLAICISRQPLPLAVIGGIATCAAIGPDDRCSVTSGTLAVSIPSNVTRTHDRRKTGFRSRKVLIFDVIT